MASHFCVSLQPWVNCLGKAITNALRGELIIFRLAQSNHTDKSGLAFTSTELREMKVSFSKEKKKELFLDQMNSKMSNQIYLVGSLDVVEFLIFVLLSCRCLLLESSFRSLVLVFCKLAV